jgi:hypothetical protein
MAFPSVSFSPSDVVIGHTNILQLISTGGSPTTTNLIGKVLDYDGSNQVLRVKFPDANGIKRTRKKRRVESVESFLFETKEFKKIVTLLAGKMTDVVDFTSAQFWIKDFDDAAGNVAIKTDAFPCSVQRENGKNRFAAEGGDDAGTSVVLLIESTKNGEVILTVDGAA